MDKAGTFFGVGISLGLASGPFFGGFIYGYLGYVGPFFLFGIVTLLYIVLKACFPVQATIDQAIEEKMSSTMLPVADFIGNRKMKAGDILRNPVSGFNSLSGP